MARNWTDAQQLAMRPLGKTVLVSAAAGSGKTATLTERIIRRLTDPDHPADLSRMLIITFTRAATAELRQRISDALTDAIAKDPGNRYLQKQLMGMGGAHISTIDSFFYEPVKAHFAECGFPSSFRIADDAELRPLCEKIMEELIDEFYRSYADPALGGDTDAFSLLRNNPFADLCDALTPSKEDSELVDTLLDFYSKLFSFPQGLERLRTQAEETARLAEEDYFKSPYGAVLAQWTVELCDSFIAYFSDACDRMATDPLLCTKYLPSFIYDRDFLVTLRRAVTEGSYERTRALLETRSPVRLGTVKPATLESEAFKEGRTKRNKAVGELIKDPYAPHPSEIAEDMRRTARMCRVLYDLLTAYDRRITEEKRTRGICTFDDNRRNFLSLLLDDKGQPTELAREYLENYDEVYIDEYQDVDEVQDTIFALIGGDHRFMVGDIKQSIYGFRGSDPSVFARYRKEVRLLDPSNPYPLPPTHTGYGIFMSNNFRCDESVIRVSNTVCGHIFRACPDSMDYRPEDDLRYSKDKPRPDYVSPAVQVAVLQTEKAPQKEARGLPPELVERENVMSEAIYVANRIAHLLRSGARLANGKPITPGDIAILSRTKTCFGAYISALNDMGIPTGCAELEKEQATKDVLHGSDMLYLVNLLRVMNNPDGDLPLAELLRAPFPGMSLEEVVTLRQDTAKEGSLYASLEAYADLSDGEPALREKCAAFRQWLEGYRELCTTLPADGILRLLRRDPHCACRRTPAFTYLYDSARSCRLSSFAGVYTFLRYFEKKLATSKNSPASGEVTEGHVSLMSIHNSKGLEFPVCFVVQCGHTFSTRSVSDDMLFDKHTGMAMKLYDREGHRKYNTALRDAAALSITRGEREEEMRLLYVAMTRARERLYLVGCSGKTEFDTFPEGDRYEALDCSSYLPWIMSALGAHPEITPFVEKDFPIAADILPDEPLHLSMGQTAETAEDPAVKRYRDILSRHVPPSPMEEALRSVPTKVPASRLVDDLLDQCVFFQSDRTVGDEDKLPASEQGVAGIDPRTVDSIRASVKLMASGASKEEFELLLRANARPTAVEKGTAMHMFLQYCDYDRVMKDGAENEISRLREEGFITARVADILDRKHLGAFFDSRFFARVRAAVKVERELRFARFVPLRTLTKNEALAEALGDRTLYVQGSIDLLCEFPDGHIELCDYKTDHITKEERNDPAILRARMTEKHGHQLSQYAAAIEEMYGKKPTKVYIYSVPLGDAVEIDA